jgi:hypothetical protein
MNVCAFAIVCLCVSRTAALAQLPAPPTAAPNLAGGTGIIIGQVIDRGTGRGVPGAVVRLEGSSAGTRQALTTTDGRFLFRDLKAGSYSVAGAKPGYIGGAYGARRPGGGSAPIELGEGERFTTAVVPLWKSGSIAGTVVDEAGEPIVGVEVRAFGRDASTGRRQIAAASGGTDDRGVYRISGLEPGTYVIAVVVSQTWVPTTVAEAYREAVQSNDPGRSSLTSTFTDAGILPVIPGSPATLQVGSMIQSTFRGPTPPPITDESRMYVYPTIFFPSARTMRSATPLTLRSGEERTGVDLQLRPVRTTRISGTLVGPDGPGANIGVRLESPEDDDFEGGIATMTDATGAFTLPAVPAGQYVLRAARVPRATASVGTVTVIHSGSFTMSTSAGSPVSAPPPASTEPTLWAALPIAVGNTPLTGLTIPLQIGSRIRGRVEFEGTAERPENAALQRIPIMIEPVTPPTTRMRFIPPTRVDANGEFTTGGVPGGRYFLRALTGPPGWHFKEARYESLDLADTPIALEGRDLTGVTIVFTDRRTELSGTVRNERGADRDATVLIFPADTEQWHTARWRRMRTARTSSSGVYKLTGLPAGEYYLAAVADEASAEWQDPEVLASLAREASRVTLNDGERKTLDLRTQQR